LLEDGKLTISELDLWLSGRVERLTGMQQARVTRRPDILPDFPSSPGALIT